MKIDNGSQDLRLEKMKRMDPNIRSKIYETLCELLDTLEWEKATWTSRDKPATIQRLTGITENRLQSEEKKLSLMIAECAKRTHFWLFFHFFRGRRELTHQFYKIVAHIEQDPQGNKTLEDLQDFKTAFIQKFTGLVFQEDPSYVPAYTPPDSLTADHSLQSESVPHRHAIQTH